MDITINAPKSSVANGMGFYELFLGIDTYTAVRSGEPVKIACTDGEVAGSVSSIVIGPLGQFLGQGQPHVANLGRGYDVRSVVDAIDARYPASVKANAKALDPRTIYTAVYVTVPYVAPAAIPVAA